MNLKSRFVGGMIGSAVGDAIGELAFRCESRATLRAAIQAVDLLRYTDDTAMTLALAEVLIQLGQVEPQYLGDRFRAHYEHEPWRGYAAGPPTIFNYVARHGGRYIDAAQSLFGGWGSFGNGAAMRVSPIGLFFHGRDCYDPARLSSIPTHAHPVGVDGAAVIAQAVARATEMDPREPFPLNDFLAEMQSTARTEPMREQLELLGRLLEDADMWLPFYVGLKLGGGVAAQESVPFALYAFMRHPTSFEDCLFCAALHSSDRDTVAAMAGAISGAYLGVEAIPAVWREKLENRGHIERLALELAAEATG